MYNRFRFVGQNVLGSFEWQFALEGSDLPTATIEFFFGGSWNENLIRIHVLGTAGDHAALAIFLYPFPQRPIFPQPASVTCPAVASATTDNAHHSLCA